MESCLHKIKSAILGHATGDALGVPVEFTTRSERKCEPVTGMMGYGTYPYPAGTWSDDTSMTIATLDSVICGIDYEDMMKRFCLWFDEAKYTATGELFDIGIATRKSLMQYLLSNIPATDCGQKGDWDNGNGSLMRIIPVVLYLAFSEERNKTIEEKISCIEKASSLTHGHPRSFVGCGIYAFILFELLQKPGKASVIKGLEKAREFYKNHSEFKYYEWIFEKDFQTLSEDNIIGNGYVVNCLAASLWCLITTDSYKDCVLKAVNLGDDTDTTAAVAGGLAGVLYGFDSIPMEWLDTLKRKDYIEDLCIEAANAWNKEKIKIK